jgi:hypothetical protein
LRMTSPKKLQHSTWQAKEQSAALGSLERLLEALPQEP